ncbi:hypothetical protein GFL03_21895 [Pseudomonas stutzeri]|uniref:hypothetical protein n=1 Tax=Stutzerimonas TaxID=2901164 RepID=UPI000F787EBC|nr:MULTISPECIES: hypothetical protein [Stutzerimonas]MBK3919928.1 hypothetical protein [Stutzerimonas frequens]
MTRQINTPGKKWIAAAKDPGTTQTHDDPSVSGFFKITSGGVVFYDLQGIPFAFLVTRPGENFFVTCSLTEGGLRYMFSTSSKTEELLGIDGLTYSESANLATEISESIACEKAISTLAAFGFNFDDFVDMANRKTTSDLAHQAFFKAGMTVAPRGIEDDGYLLASRLGRVMLFRNGYQYAHGLWIASTEAAA